MLKRILVAASLLLAASAPVWSQAGQFPSGNVQGNAGASPGQGKPSTVTAILDRALGSTRGAIIERGSAGWGIIGPSATAGLAFLSGGTGADPGYAILGLVGGGTGCSTASGACLDNITGFSATTGYLTRTGPGAYSFSFPAFSQVTGSLACSQGPARTGVVTSPAGSCANIYPNANANTVLSNWSASAVAPIFNTWPACANDGAHALVYINGTGLVCGTLTTGGTVTSIVAGTGLSGGTITTTGTIAVSLSTLTNSIGADVLLSNVSNYFTGPTVAQGTSGTWFASGTVTLISTGTDAINCRLWDGATIIASARTAIAIGGTNTSISLSGYLANPAGNIRIDCNDPSTTGGKISANSSGNTRDSTLSVFRIS